MSKLPRPATADEVCCPLCSGHGRIERTKLVRRIEDKEFARTLQNYIDEVTYGSMQLRDNLPPTGEETVDVVHGADHETVQKWRLDQGLWHKRNT